MEQIRTMRPVAHIRTDFKEKFGLPRQSGMVRKLKGTVVFEPEYRDANMLKGLNGFSHLWILWDFSMVHQDEWHPTVRPPRLGGNQRMGVFATRSPYRPNPIGLSVVRLDGIRDSGSEGLVLDISGCDMLDNTPVYDIKPYLPYSDAIEDACGGFAGKKEEPLTVEFPDELLICLPEDKRDIIQDILALDPRPRYQHDPQRIYGMSFAGYEIRFKIEDKTVHVCEVKKEEK